MERLRVKSTHASRHRNTSDGRTPVETDDEDEGIIPGYDYPPEYIATPGPTAEQYEQNRQIAAEMNGHYNEGNDDSEDESPQLMLIYTEIENDQPVIKYDPSIFGLVMTSACAVLMFIGVNLRAGAHSIRQEIIPMILQHRLAVTSLVLLGIIIGGGEAIVTYDCKEPKLLGSYSLLAVNQCREADPDIIQVQKEDLYMYESPTTQKLSVKACKVMVAYYVAYGGSASHNSLIEFDQYPSYQIPTAGQCETYHVS